MIPARSFFSASIRPAARRISGICPITRQDFLEGMMKNSLKGALLSGLVFPGLGQMVLRHSRRGVALMLIVFLSLAVIVVKAVQKSLIVLEKIKAEGGIVDAGTISQTAAQATTASEGLMMNALLLLLVVCWIFGIIDAYRIGKKMDAAEQNR